MCASLLSSPSFRSLWLGQTFVLCASQFWFVALTWLVLEKTGSGFSVSLVLMAAAIPRGLFMLLGGAISDRLATSLVATAAAAVNAVLIGFVAILLFFNIFSLSALVLAATLFGLSEAFLYPALLALVPQLALNKHLKDANAWMQGSEQITNVVGPAMAGIVLGVFGLSAAFAINTGLMAIGSGLISCIKRRRSQSLERIGSGTLTKEIVEGLRYAWRQSAVRFSLILIAMINLALLGPVVIGVAELVRTRFDGSATTFGYLQSAYGVGALLGVLLASRLDAVRELRVPLILLTYSLGIELIMLGLAQNIWVSAIIIALMGVGGGSIGVLGLTWLQQKTTTHMQGRMMSLVMFAAVALDPFSQAISGALVEVSLVGLFATAGSMMLLTAFLASPNRLTCRPTK